MATWRGLSPTAPLMTVCTCMSAPLNELQRLFTERAKARGIPNVVFTGIKGFGSYQSGTTATGAIGTGGGHIDLNLENLSSAQRLLAEAIAREIGWYADIRAPKWWSAYWGKWLYASWQWHLHMLLKKCPHLSAAALAQIAEWQVQGENGLAGDDKDDGPRTFVNRTWAAYLAIKNAVVSIAEATAIASKVKLLQAAVRQVQDGKWGPVTDAALYRTWVVRKEGAAKFKAYSLANRKAMQGSWGTTPDGIWGPKTAAANLAAVKKMQSALGVVIDGVWGSQSYWAFVNLRNKAFKP